MTNLDLNLIQLKEVSVRHHAAADRAPHALRELSFSIAAGEQVAVIGSSGAGKTTLLHLLACALRPDAGELNLFVHSSLPAQLAVSLRTTLLE